MLIGVLPLSTTTTSSTTTTKKTITKTNQDSDKGWEMRAGARDADASRAQGKFFFTILYIFYTTLMFYRYHNDKEPPPPPVTLTTHHSHLNVSNDPKTATTKKATRVGR